MNMNSIKQTLSRSYGRGSLIVQKYSPEILLGVGLIGGVVSAVLAAKATLKVEEIVKAHASTMEQIESVAKDHKDDYMEADTKKDKAVVYVQTGLKLAKLYGPSLSIGALSITAILASHGVMAQRQVALVGAYNLVVEGFKTYRQRVIDDLGQEVDHNYLYGLKDETYTEKVTDEEGNVTKVKKTRKIGAPGYTYGSIYSRFFDESNPQYRSDRNLNKAFLLAQQNYLNDMLTIRGHVYLNEVYEALGFPHTKEGGIVGWVLRSPEQMQKEGRDGYIDFGIHNIYNDPGREFVNLTNPTILLDFNVDGIMYHLV